MSEPLHIREMQIKTIWYFILPTSEWPRLINQMTMTARVDAGKGEHLFTLGDSTNCCNHYGNQCMWGEEGFLKK